MIIHQLQDLLDVLNHMHFYIFILKWNKIIIYIQTLRKGKTCMEYEWII